MQKLAISLGLATLLAACAHTGPAPGSDDAAEDFAHLYLKTMRWEGAKASAALVAPELRREYLDKIRADGLEDTLKITEFDVKELGHLRNDVVTVGAQLNWYLEPGVTVKHEEAQLQLEFRDGHWLVVGVEGGPIPIAPLIPAPDGGA